MWRELTKAVKFDKRDAEGEATKTKATVSVDYSYAARGPRSGSSDARAVLDQMIVLGRRPGPEDERVTRAHKQRGTVQSDREDSLQPWDD